MDNPSAIFVAESFREFNAFQVFAPEEIGTDLATLCANGQENVEAAYREACANSNICASIL